MKETHRLINKIRFTINKFRNQPPRLTPEEIKDLFASIPPGDHADITFKSTYTMRQLAFQLNLPEDSLPNLILKLQQDFAQILLGLNPLLKPEDALGQAKLFVRINPNRIVTYDIQGFQKVFFGNQQQNPKG